MTTPAYPDSPRRYCAKPVVIEARQLTEHNRHEVGRWCKAVNMYYEGLDIKTLEGVMRADLGDWIIKGTRGEFYPCKPDVFATKYEETSMTDTEPYRMAEPKNFGAAVIDDSVIWIRDIHGYWRSGVYVYTLDWCDLDDPHPYQNCILTANDPEPPIESVVLDCEGDPWKRSSLEHEWCGVEGDDELPWRDLCYQLPPVTLLYRGEA